MFTNLKSIFQTKIKRVSSFRCLLIWGSSEDNPQKYTSVDFKADQLLKQGFVFCSVGVDLEVILRAAL